MNTPEGQLLDGPPTVFERACIAFTDAYYGERGLWTSLLDDDRAQIRRGMLAAASVFQSDFAEKLARARLNAKH